MNNWYLALGFTAQALFSARMLIQWILSEKAGKSVSPAIYWQLSLLASVLFLVYGFLRDDFVIILGQIISYYIYIWNLNTKNIWKPLPAFMRFGITMLPPIIIAYMIFIKGVCLKCLFTGVPVGWLLFGSAGQIIFTLRFIYQWLYSKARNESLLPAGFWRLSITGSFITIIYAIFRNDPVLIIGQGVGFITYIRNLFIAKKEKEKMRV